MKEKKLRLHILKVHTARHFETENKTEAKELLAYRKKMIRDGFVEGSEGGWEADGVSDFPQLSITTKGLAHIKDLESTPWYQRPIGKLILAVITALVIAYAIYFLGPRNIKHPNEEQVEEAK